MTDIQADLKPFQFSLRKLLAFVAVISVVCGVLFALREAVKASRRRALTQMCVDRLINFGRTWQGRYETDGSFGPPSFAQAEGQPVQSWRVFYCWWHLRSIHIPFAYDFSLPWDHPSNAKASANFAGLFWCRFSKQPLEKGLTNFVMIVAPEGSHPDVVVFAEIDDSGIYWTEPRDLTFEEMSVKINDRKKRDHHPHGAMAGDCKGIVKGTGPIELLSTIGPVPFVYPAALRFNAPEYYLGLSDGCCDPAAKAWYLQQITVPLTQVTFSNIFVNGNYERFRQFDLSEAAIVANQGGDYWVPDDAINTNFDIDRLVERLLQVDRTILVSAGPASCVIIHRYWKRAAAPEATGDRGCRFGDRRVDQGAQDAAISDAGDEDLGAGLHVVREG